MAICVAAALERANKTIRLVVEAGQPVVGCSDAALRLLHLRGRLDQRRGEPRTVGADRFDLSFDRPTLFVGRAHRILDAPQFGFLFRPLLFGRSGSGRRRIGARVQRPAERCAERGSAEPESLTLVQPHPHRGVQDHQI